jgi:hypothetical protein
MSVKYQIFISSTYEDLKKERDEVVKSILEMGHIPVGMEMFSAGDEGQWKVIARTIEFSDYYVVIIAHRYGSMDGIVSYTEKEYDYAASIRVPILAFLIDESAVWSPDWIEDETKKKAGLEKFKAKVRMRMVTKWKSAEDLYGKVPVALMKQINITPRQGWVRSSAVINPEVTNELSRLSRENAELRVQLTENPQLVQCATILHRINHMYRDLLSKLFRIHKGETLLYSLEAAERDTLQAACQKIADMFSLLISHRCIVTVKLIRVDTPVGEGQVSYCSTLARSELTSERDQIPIKYEINTGKNTAFDTALRFDSSRVSHFFSPDLEKDAAEGKYCNQRQDWKRFYRSAIVVPIRSVNYEAIGSANAFDELGFLAVDCMGRNVLNDGLHLQFLASFADQMYNFMSLMRGKYSLPAEGSVENPLLSSAPGSESRHDESGGCRAE